MQKNVKNLIVISLTIGTLTLGGCFSAFAASTNNPASEVKSSTAQNKNCCGKHHRWGHQRMDVSSLVSKGIIDQKTADAITTYMTQRRTERKAEMDKVKNMTDTERKAYFESKKSETRVGLLDQLISAGIITRDQAAAIKKAQS
jgi:hypothetical protein